MTGFCVVCGQKSRRRCQYGIKRFRGARGLLLGVVVGCVLAAVALVLGRFEVVLRDV